MKRTTFIVPLGDGLNKHITKIQSDPCESDTQLARKYQIDMIKAMADNTDILKCGGHYFKTMKMSFDGEFWVIDLEAIG